MALSGTLQTFFSGLPRVFHAVPHSSFQGYCSILAHIYLLLFCTHSTVDIKMSNMIVDLQSRTNSDRLISLMEDEVSLSCLWDIFFRYHQISTFASHYSCVLCLASDVDYTRYTPNIMSCHTPTRVNILHLNLKPSLKSNRKCKMYSGLKTCILLIAGANGLISLCS